jgi:hypothetical protein
MEQLFLNRPAVFFIRRLSDEVLDNIGVVIGFTLTPRLLANHFYGHHRRHLNITGERYL